MICSLQQLPTSCAQLERRMALTVAYCVQRYVQYRATEDLEWLPSSRCERSENSAMNWYICVPCHLYLPESMRKSMRSLLPDNSFDPSNQLHHSLKLKFGCYCVPSFVPSTTKLGNNEARDCVLTRSQKSNAKHLGIVWITKHCH